LPACFFILHHGFILRALPRLVWAAQQSTSGMEYECLFRCRAAFCDDIQLAVLNAPLQSCAACDLVQSNMRRTVKTESVCPRSVWCVFAINHRQSHLSGDVGDYL